MLVREGPVQGVLHLRLARPQKLNALNLELARALLREVQAAEADAAVRVIVLQGEGRAFCAGKDRDEPGTPEFADLLQKLAAALMQSAKPVVAGVQGWAVGAGLELLLNCDIVVAARDAQFALPEVNVGLFGTGGVLALLPRKVGLARAKGLLMLGQPVGAQQAADWGLLWKVVEDHAALQAELAAIAMQLAQADARLLGTLKQALHAEAVGDFAAVLTREAQAHRALG